MAAQPRFRAGMVGAGNICQYHVAAVQALPDVELVGITDLDQRRAEEAGVGAPAAHRPQEPQQDPDQVAGLGDGRPRRPPVDDEGVDPVAAEGADAIAHELGGDQDEQRLGHDAEEKIEPHRHLLDRTPADKTPIPTT